MYIHCIYMYCMVSMVYTCMCSLCLIQNVAMGELLNWKHYVQPIQESDIMVHSYVQYMYMNAYVRQIKYYDTCAYTCTYMYVYMYMYIHVLVAFTMKLHAYTFVPVFGLHYKWILRKETSLVSILNLQYVLHNLYRMQLSLKRLTESLSYFRITQTLNHDIYISFVYHYSCHCLHFTVSMIIIIITERCTVL